MGGVRHSIQKIDLRTIVVALSLCACTTGQPTTEVTAPIATSGASTVPNNCLPGLAVYLQNVTSGDAAFQRVTSAKPYTLPDYLRPDEGWQYVAFDLILENVSEFSAPSPEILWGKVIDSGGYERPFGVNLSTGGLGNTGQAFSQQVLLPGVRYRQFGYTSIPLNQTPAHLHVGVDDVQFPCQFDAKKPSDELAVPFENTPPLSSSAAVLEYTWPQEYRYKLWNLVTEISAENGVGVVGSVEIENLGGYNLSFSSSGPGIVAVDSNGYYFDAFNLGGGGLAPGLTQSIEARNLIWIPKQYPQPDWVWLALVDQRMMPVAQVTVDFP
jgi:hypothetical protein